MDQWDDGSDYDAFMGRWSRLVADSFVDELGVGPGSRWLDVGCGTGALVAAVVDRAAPAGVAGVDPSPDFVAIASSRFANDATFQVAGGDDLPFGDDVFDVVVSGLALNFIPDPVAAVREWQRVVVGGGGIHAYVWDYADGMTFLRTFWDTAVRLDASAGPLDEAVRFPVCRPEGLTEVFSGAGLVDVATGSIEIDTVFGSFEEFWTPFLRGQGPAPSYVATLSPADRVVLEHELRSTLPTADDGAIRLTARAWTVSGIPGS